MPVDAPPASAASDVAGRRLRVARRYQVLGLLSLVSVLYWLGVWAWTESVAARELAEGGNEAAITVHVFGLVYQATWAYVAGLVGVHALLAALAAWRHDREGLVGVGWSAFFHAAFVVGQGIVGG